MPGEAPMTTRTSMSAFESGKDRCPVGFRFKLDLDPGDRADPPLMTRGRVARREALKAVGRVVVIDEEGEGTVEVGFRRRAAPGRHRAIGPRRLPGFHLEVESPREILDRRRAQRPAGPELATGASDRATPCPPGPRRVDLDAPDRGFSRYVGGLSGTIQFAVPHGCDPPLIAPRPKSRRSRAAVASASSVARITWSKAPPSMTAGFTS